MRLIDADKLKAHYAWWGNEYASDELKERKRDFDCIVDIQPTADERKHGRWIDLRQEGDNRFMCSVCKWKEHVPTCMGEPTVWEYCPSCGARMEDNT